MPIYRLENQIQNYAWGSYTAIAELLSKNSPSLLPQAELWIGAHHRAPSKVICSSNKYILLTDLIKNNPEDVLGRKIFKKFGPNLPYLFKILAIDKPLSIQVHPNKKQAIDGFNRENYKKKHIDSSERNYIDRNNKLEFICALTTLSGFNGFRKIAEIQSLIDMICPFSINKLFEAFKQEPNKIGLEIFFRKLALLSKEAVESVVFQALSKARELKNRFPIFKWVCNLADIYPNEISVFAPLVLNFFKLEPGEAIFIREGIIHTYMKGMGVEVMANSDNVLRGGLTRKKVNISEFLNTIRFDNTPVNTIDSEIIRQYEKRYKIITKEFSLSIINLIPNQVYFSPKERSAEILFCTYGEGYIIDKNNDLSLLIKKGESILVTASVERYILQGKMTLFKSGVPLY